jgi:hypothetical protein
MALTSAERQRKYREKSSERGKNGERCINIWLAAETVLALQQLAKRTGLAQRQVLEKLITEANEQLSTTNTDMERTS